MARDILFLAPSSTCGAIAFVLEISLCVKSVRHFMTWRVRKHWKIYLMYSPRNNQVNKDTDILWNYNRMCFILYCIKLYWIVILMSCFSWERNFLMAFPGCIVMSSSMYIWESVFIRRASKQKVTSKIFKMFHISLHFKTKFQSKERTGNNWILQRRLREGEATFIPENVTQEGNRKKRRLHIINW